VSIILDGQLIEDDAPFDPDMSQALSRTLDKTNVLAMDASGSTGPVILRFYKDHSWAPKGIKLKRAMASPRKKMENSDRLFPSAQD